MKCIIILIEENEGIETKPFKRTTVRIQSSSCENRRAFQRVINYNMTIYRFHAIRYRPHTTKGIKEN